jgi:hypothetical protein
VTTPLPDDPPQPPPDRQPRALGRDLLAVALVTTGAGAVIFAAFSVSTELGVCLSGVVAAGAGLLLGYDRDRE